MAGEVSFSQQRVQASGPALVMSRKAFLDTKAACPRFAAAVSAYHDAFVSQLLQTSACLAAHPAQERLARWLLEMDDRVQGRPLALTHDVLALMTGVSRPTVTLLNPTTATPGFTFTAGAGDVNNLTVTYAAGSYVFTDTGAVITTAVVGCAGSGTNTVTCPTTLTVGTPLSITINLADGADTASTAIGLSSTVISGGTGNDVLTGDALAPFGVTLNGDDGDDTLTAGPGSTDLNGGANNDTLTGGPAGDDFTGDAGNDTMLGNGGGDDFVGGPGADSIGGGPGSDSVSYANNFSGIGEPDPLAGVSVTLDGVANDGAAGEGDNVGTDVESVIGTNGPDTIVGSPLSNSLQGGGGNDAISGGGGGDSLSGGTGEDVLDGGPGSDFVNGDEGNDTLTGGDSSDSVQGGGGNDTISGGNGGDNLTPGAGQDTVAGGSGFDTVSYEERDGNVTVTLDGAANDGEAGENDTVGTDVEGIESGNGNDTLTGSGVDNDLSGGNGNDTLSGGGGDDDLSGDDGDDTLSGGVESDELSGGDGNDTITAEDGNDEVFAGNGNDTITGGNGNGATGGPANTLSIAGSMAPSVVGAATALGGTGTPNGANGQVTIDGNVQP